MSYYINYKEFFKALALCVHCQKSSKFWSQKVNDSSPTKGKTSSTLFGTNVLSHAGLDVLGLQGIGADLSCYARHLVQFQSWFGRAQASDLQLSVMNEYWSLFTFAVM